MDQPLNIRWFRDLPSEPSTVTVIREADGRWYIACRVVVAPQTLEDGRDHIGGELNLIDFVTLKISNPCHLKRRQWRLARDQR